MSRKGLPRYTYVQCCHVDCKREGSFQYDTQRDMLRIHREQGGRWQCDEHSGLGHRLLPTRMEIVTRLENKRSKDHPGLDHLFWGGSNGYAHGPGFEARSKDWPAGTVLEVTARVIVAPETDDGKGPP